MTKEITSLRQQKNDPNRVNVFIDGSFSFGINRISGVSLRVGQNISEEEIIKLIKDDTFESRIDVQALAKPVLIEEE